MILKITIASQILTYELTRKNVKNINIRIHPDKSIHISANKKVSVKEIEALLVKKSDWILKAMAHYDKKDFEKTIDFLLRDGAKICLLGKEYKIKILQAYTDKIELDSQTIRIYTRDFLNSKRIESMWNKWIGSYTRQVLGETFENIYPLFKVYGVKYPEVKFRNMKTLWGSCKVNGGSITLNTKLVHFPRECIEYVVAHELAHFIHPNHSKEFYDLLSEIMPDHRMRREIMKKK